MTDKMNAQDSAVLVAAILTAGTLKPDVNAERRVEAFAKTLTALRRSGGITRLWKTAGESTSG